jgi:hypothetical protein
MGYASRQQGSERKAQASGKLYWMRGGSLFAVADMKDGRRGATVPVQVDQVFRGKVDLNPSLGLSVEPWLVGGDISGNHAIFDGAAGVRILGDDTLVHAVIVVAADTAYAHNLVDQAIYASVDDGDYGGSSGPAVGAGDIFSSELPAVLQQVYSDIPDEAIARFFDPQYMAERMRLEQRRCAYIATWAASFGEQVLARFQSNGQIVVEL